MSQEDRAPEIAPDEEPEIYAVEKDVGGSGGWRFDRRTFLRAAGATAAAATAATATGCTLPGGKGEAATKERVVVEVSATPSSTPEPPEGAEATEGPVQREAPVATGTEPTTPSPEPSATPTATDTPRPTRTPTPAVPQAEFVKDVTIPDGTVMKPNNPFTKTWRFKNVGAVPWGQGVKHVFVSGEHNGYESKKMQGPDSVDVANVQPGKGVSVSVDLVSPAEPGHYRSYWRLQLGNGEWLEDVHYVDIYVARKRDVQPGEEGVQFKVKVEGKWVTWTQPCGMPIPPGAVCICDCVSVPVCTCDGHCSCDNVCTCDEVCTCDTVCSCVGHTVCTCDAVHYWYPC